MQETDKRFVSLGSGDHGWPPILSTDYTNLNALWHRGPAEPPESLCKDPQGIYIVQLLCN